MKTKCVFAAVVFYAICHCVWPFRHLLYPGRASWTEQGHCFAWRMMLRGKTVGIRYFVTDSASRRTELVDPRPVLSHLQMVSFGRDPEMILHLAHYIASEYRLKYQRDVEVRALILTSLNGRKPQLQIDPNVDLAKIPRGYFIKRPWILRLTEPLPAVPWSVPVSEWEQHVSIPRLTFLERRENAIGQSQADESLDGHK